MPLRVTSWIIFVLIVPAYLTVQRSTSRASEITTIAGSGRQTQNRLPKRPTKPTVQKRVDYSRFSHQLHVTQQKLSCDSCHKVPTTNWKEVRKGEAAFPDVAEFPEHSTCINCHRQQFFARERPAPAICSNCHVNVTPRDTTRFLFPSLGDVTGPTFKRRDSVSEFGVEFPHDKHLDVVGLNGPRFRQGRTPHFVAAAWQGVTQKQAEQPKSCPVCHQTYQPQGDSSEEYATPAPKSLGDNFWLKKGTFKTVPNSHAMCFTCHSAESELPPAPADCNACHKLFEPAQGLNSDFDLKLATEMGITDKTVLNGWSRRISAGAFRHEGGEHPGLICTGCHNVAQMNTLDPKTTRVAMVSCGGAEGCHITATTDDGGALNYEIDHKKANASFVCSKCHITFGKGPVPESHFAVIPKPATK